MAFPSSRRASPRSSTRHSSIPRAGQGGARNWATVHACVHQNLGEHAPRHRDPAIWKTTYRPRLTTLAPILMSFSGKLVSDHGSAASGIAGVRMKFAEIVGERAKLKTVRFDAWLSNVRYRFLSPVSCHSAIGQSLPFCAHSGR
jgi:hypothetical protein